MADVLQGILTLADLTPRRISDEVGDAPVQELLVERLPSASGSVAFAPRSDVTPADGHPLQPGQFRTLRPRRLSELWFVTDTPGQQVFWFADTRRG